MSWLASFYPHHDVWCERCHEWSDPADWDEVDDETIACPNCEAENGPLDGPLYSRKKGQATA
jgi:hypothetical protein